MTRKIDLSQMAASGALLGQVPAWDGTKWVAGDAGLPEAPQDGNRYVRQAGEWIDVNTPVSPNPIAVTFTHGFNAGIVDFSANTVFDDDYGLAVVGYPYGGVDFSIAGWTELADIQQYNSGNGQTINGELFSKFLNDGEGTATVSGQGNGGGVMIVARNVDKTNPLDVPLQQSYAFSGGIAPPAITPVTPGSVIVCLATTNGYYDATDPGGVDNFLSYKRTSGGFSSTHVCYSVVWDGEGEFQPPVLAQGGMWAAFTIALRPETPTPTSFDLTDGDKGDITVASEGTSWTIDNGAVSLSKMAPLAANSIIGNNSGSAATPTALSGTQATALLNVFGETTKGLVPAPTTASGKFLKDDGTWAVVEGGSGGGGGVAGYEEIIETIDLDGTSAVASFTVPSGYKHLRLIGSAHSAAANTADTLWMRFNSDATSTYYQRRENIYGGNADTLDRAEIGSIMGASSGGLLLSAIQTEIWDYANPSFYTTYTSVNGLVYNGTDAFTQTVAGSWRVAAAVTQIDLTVSSGGNFGNGSSFTLIGVRDTQPTSGGGSGGASGVAVPTNPPLATEFTLQSSTSGAMVDTAQGLLLTQPAVSGVNTTRAYQSLPAGDFCLTAKFKGLQRNTNYTAFGIGIGDSGSTARYDFYNYNYDTRPRVEVRSVPSEGSPYSGTLPFAAFFEPCPAWWRITRTGTTYSYQLSMDGINWMAVYSETQASVPGLTNADLVHFFAYTNNTAQPSQVLLEYWELVTGSAVGTDEGMAITYPSGGAVSGEETAGSPKWQTNERRLSMSVTVVAGSYTNNPNSSLGGLPVNSFFWASGNTAAILRFDHGENPPVITGVGIGQNVTTAQGTWDYEGANDVAGPWTTLKAGFTWQPAAVNGLTIDLEEFTNETAYRYTRLKQVGGSTNNGPYVNWFIFKHP